MEMEKMFAADLADSSEILGEEWEKRSPLFKIRELLAHLLSRWL
jgi:hypothetical protein